MGLIMGSVLGEVRCFRRMASGLRLRSPMFFLGG